MRLLAFILAMAFTFLSYDSMSRHWFLPGMIFSVLAIFAWVVATIPGGEIDD